MNGYLEPYSLIKSKICGLMTKLRGIKLSATLKENTDLQPILANTTRWSSTASMLKRYNEIREFLKSFEDKRTLLDWLTKRKRDQLNLRSEQHIDSLSSVTLALQRKSIDLSSSRLFDAIIAIM